MRRECVGAREGAFPVAILALLDDGAGDSPLLSFAFRRRANDKLLVGHGFVASGGSLLLAAGLPGEALEKSRYE